MPPCVSWWATPAEENQALLEELEALTGQDGEAVLELLEAYGLLDEDGNLITDQTIILNGAEYTLEEIEAMLDDPATDLSEVGYVGDTPHRPGGPEDHHRH